MIKALNIENLCKLLSAECIQSVAGNSATVIERVHTDTRTLKNGDLFVALQGDRFDGHDYLQLAADKGAVAALVSKQVVTDKNLLATSPLPLIVVADTLLGLGEISRWNRSNFNGQLLAITGSAGKTSVKTMAAHVLASQGDCLATKGNLNNHIGAPLTLMELNANHQFAVIELGASGLGEIAYTADFAQPDVAILTNVSGAHLEGFGSIENIALTKGEIIDATKADGTVILNRDDRFYSDWQSRAGERRVISFGLHDNADLYASDIECSPQGCKFVVHWQQQKSAAFIPLLGQHNVANALAVIAAAIAMRLEFTAIVEVLRGLPQVAGRLQTLAGVGGLSIIDDSYNASPASVKAAIDVLKLYPQKTCLVLGDMAELGDAFITTHQEIGYYARQAGIDQLIATGEGCQHAVEAFAENAHWLDNKDQLVEYIKNNIEPDQVALIKGSRSAGMDKVVKALLSPVTHGEEE